MAREPGADDVVDLDPNRRKRLNRILRQALSLPVARQKSFLDEACSDDEALRLELEALLRHRTEGAGLAESGPPETEEDDTADQSNESHSPSLIGRSLSHYRIVAWVGGGGMGVVYRAWDEHLQRDVAVKVLHPGTLSDEAARKRFRREALALSRLNHPNIETVYDFDTQEGIDFLAMEYLSGETLREKVAGGPMTEAEVVQLGGQLADGLRAAHAQGVVHCDLKPPNLITVSDGRLKILDFGLAKLLRRPGESVSIKTLSEPESAGGTFPYMSPEQLRGEPVDLRSDLFSAGAVLYEMATGRRAFDGKTRALVSDAILNREPVAPSRLNPALSTNLERIILKALEKDPRDRYQSAAQLLADLQREGAVSAPIPPEPPRWSPARVAKLSAGLLLLMVAGVTAGRLWKTWTRDEPVPEFKSFAVTATANWEGDPEVSPDGTEILYTSNASGNRDIWITDIAGGRAERLTDDAADDSAPTWFPDKSAIAFVSERSGNKDIWKLGRSNGRLELLLPLAQSPAVSPDGRFLAYSKLARGGSLRIGIMSLGARDDVRILTTDEDGLWDHFDPKWSPDGREICYWTWGGIWVVPIGGGPARVLVSGDEIASHPVWDHAGRYIYYSSYRGGTLGIWRVRAGGGPPQQVTAGTGGALSHPSLAWDGKRLVYASGSRDRQDILLNRRSGAETVFSASQTDLFASISPDGNSVVYASLRGPAGGLNLWRQVFSGGRLSGPAEALTKFPFTATDPNVSPDGRWIAYVRIVSDQRDIWMMPFSGGEHFQFTNHTAADLHPAWSPDGSRLAFVSDRGGELQLWVAPVADGKPAGAARPLPTEAVSAMLPDWSPDGSSIAFTGDAGGRSEVWLVAASGGSPARRITDGGEIRRVCWDPGSSDLIVSAAWGTSRVTLWRLNPQTGARQPLAPEVEFGGRNDHVGMFELSRDGRYVIFARSQGSRGQICTLEALKGAF